MVQWTYQITTYAAEDIRELIPEVIGEVPEAIFCDDQGACYFDEGPNPFTLAIEQLLTQVGEEGWELVQVIPRSQQLICVWKRPR